MTSVLTNAEKWTESVMKRLRDLEELTTLTAFMTLCEVMQSTGEAPDIKKYPLVSDDNQLAAFVEEILKLAEPDMRKDYEEKKKLEDQLMAISEKLK